jgi:D-alanyl-D-alanine carboxypeptidase
MRHLHAAQGHNLALAAQIIGQRLAGMVTGRERSSRGKQVAEVRRLLGEAATALDEIDR